MHTKANPPARIHATLTHISGYAVLVGGCDLNNNSTEFSFGDVWLFKNHEWYLLNVSIIPRAMHSACVYKGNIVISGGMRYEGGVKIL